MIRNTLKAEMDKLALDWPKLFTNASGAENLRVKGPGLGMITAGLMKLGWGLRGGRSSARVQQNHRIMEILDGHQRQAAWTYACAIPIALSNFTANRVIALPKRDLMGNRVRRSRHAALPAFSHLRKVGTLYMREIALAIVQKNGDELRVHLRSDHEIGDFVSVDVLRRDLESPGGPNEANWSPWAGAEFEFQGIFGLRRAIVRDSNHRQVGLQIAIEISNREMRGALRERVSDKEGRWTIQTAVYEWQEDQQQAGAKDGKREGREPEKGARGPDHAATVYRMAPGCWQS